MNPYDILGLKDGASREDVDRSWRRLAMIHHPDRNPGDQEAAARFHAVNEAYAAITGRAPIVDPVEQMALTLLAMTTRQLLGEMLAKGKEPKEEDLVDDLREHLRRNLTEARQRLRGQEKGLVSLEALAGRFSGPNATLLEDIVCAGALGDARGQLQRTQQEIAALQRAVELLAGCAFRADEKTGVYQVSKGRTSFVTWSL